jgi:parallel beta-helix repeat protein
MTYTFKLSRRLAMARYSGMIALLALAAACTENEPFNTPSADTYSLDSPVRVEVSPKSVTAEVNQPIQLAARERLASGKTVAVTVDWTTSGGTISADGLFTASSPGKYRLEGRGRGGKKGDTTTVIVIDSVPNLTALILSPDTATVQQAQSRQFVAQGELSDGSTTAVGAVWKASGGSIDAGGNYVAGTTSGHYHVIATNVSGSLADTAAVFVPEAAPTLTALVLTPATATLATGSTQQFAVQGRLSDGSVTTVQAQYSAAGGMITSSGLFTAGSAAGSYRVIATSAEGPADTSDVTVTAALPSTGPVIYPGSDIQAAVDANPAGTSFLLKAGVHRMQQVKPKNGDSFTAEAGAILSGARLLTTFARSGSYWVASGQTQQGVSTDPIHCEPGYEGCQWPEDLFLDDRLLVRVTSLGAVAPGKWFFDYDADKIYIGDDPSGRRVETSVSAYAFGGTASNVILKQLVIEKYAAPAQAAAIQGDDASGWQVEGCEVRQAHAIGIRIGDHWQVRGCRVHDNGQLGLSGGRTGSIVDGNDIYRNKTVPFKTGFAGGAMKFWKSDGLVFQNNRVHDNLGNGIWLDIDNINYQVHDNIVYNNAGQGIFIEISYGGKVFNNKVYGNGFGRTSSWLFGAGILVAASPDVEVYGNEVTNNANGITAIQQNRGSGAYGPHEINNLYVHDNVITMTDGKTGLAQSVGDNTYFSGRNNRWVHNTYRLGANAKYFAWVGASLSEVEWRRYGQDVDGIFQR